MIRRILLPALAGLLLLAPLPRSIAAQDSAGPAADAVTVIPEDSVQTLLARFQALQERVGVLQQEIMAEHPELQTHSAEVSSAVEQAVYVLDPTLDADMDARMPGLQQEAQAAQASGNTARLDELQAEYVALRTRAEQAELEVLKQPEIKALIDAFQAALTEKMKVKDPEIGSAIDELEALAERLQATLGEG